VVDEYVRSGKVATEFRGFPFIGSDSVTGYRYLLAAGRQDKLWNLAGALYRNQGDENSGWLTEDLVRQLAAEIPDLDVDQLHSNAQRPDIVGQASRAAAKASAGIQGTPSFLVKRGDSTPYLIEVASVDDMRAALDHALSGRSPIRPCSRWSRRIRRLRAPARPRSPWSGSPSAWICWCCSSS
jgi:protein-disulfide isomerase